MGPPGQPPNGAARLSACTPSRTAQPVPVPVVSNSSTVVVMDMSVTLGAAYEYVANTRVTRPDTDKRTRSEILDGCFILHIPIGQHCISPGRLDCLQCALIVLYA